MSDEDLLLCWCWLNTLEQSARYKSYVQLNYDRDRIRVRLTRSMVKDSIHAVLDSLRRQKLIVSATELTPEGQRVFQERALDVALALILSDDAG